MCAPVVYLITLLTAFGLASAAAAAPPPRADEAQPLRAWMRDVVDKAASDKDFDTLKAVFASLAEHAPKGYDDWAAIARKGAEKAEAGEARAVRKQCLACHMRYQRDYRETMRGAAWPTTAGAR